MTGLKVLILGGTSEAAALARSLADDERFETVLSLAGATRNPRPLPVKTRIGGYGGADGLARYLSKEGVGALIVATHPFAAQIRQHAVEAARQASVPLLLVERPAWTSSAGDRWIQVGSLEAAAEALGPAPRRVLLTTGRKELGPFADRPHHHYVVRTIDPPSPEALPAGAEVVTDRGPFDEASEIRLLTERQIDIVVTKNSGGSATAAKLHAARALGLPVVMVERRPPPRLEGVDAARACDAAGGLAWLERLHHGRGPAERGV